MRKIYLVILSAYTVLFSDAQCPVINGALVNACAIDGVTEGINEFIYFTTGASGTVSLYKLSYGSRNPPASQSPTGYLAGADASLKTGPGSIIVQPGCTIHEITSSSAIIPANSSVVFIPNNFDQLYDLSALCKNGDLYIVYININTATTTASKWLPGGTLANSATTARHIQLEYNGNTCTGNIRSYDALWAKPGNGPEAEGNSLAWDDQNNISFPNNGCSVIVTPVKLVSFNAAKKGENALLSWQTASELNTKEYQVELSTDGNHFRTIGTVLAAENSSEVRNYLFLDKSIPKYNNFYRLKIIDANGSFTYSPVTYLSFIGNAPIKAYPVIATNNLNVDLNAARREVITAVIFDHTGRSLATKKIQIITGYNKMIFPVNNFPKGEYLIRLEGENIHFTARFIKL
ncbi:MAG: hypothetical protein QM791_09650 [Ferruginibacter sp.]